MAKSVSKRLDSYGTYYCDVPKQSPAFPVTPWIQQQGCRKLNRVGMMVIFYAYEKSIVFRQFHGLYFPGLSNTYVPNTH